MIIKRMKWITREDVRANPDKIFLFGDNLERVGLGGQAGAMRGEPNAIGVPTKHSPSMSDDAFFSDDEFDFTSLCIDAALQSAINANKTIIIPADGLGTGLAELDTRAPKTFAYLEKRLSDLSSDQDHDNA